MNQDIYENFDSEKPFSTHPYCRMCFQNLRRMTYAEAKSRGEILPPSKSSRRNFSPETRVLYCENCRNIISDEWVTRIPTTDIEILDDEKGGYGKGIHGKFRERNSEKHEE